MTKERDLILQENTGCSGHLQIEEDTFLKGGEIKSHEVKEVSEK